jgi:alpha-amylase
MPTTSVLSNPRHRTAVAALAAALMSALLVVPVVRAATQARAATGAPNDVIANLFMWPWTSVAGECANVLGPAGYGAVQVSPPEDSLRAPGHPWWDIYQPVAYDLGSRMGTRQQFVSMVAACHAAGVKVYVDAVVNHMSGTNQANTGSYGGATFTNGSSYPAAGYTSADFHHYPADCPQSDNVIHDFNNQTEVQECQLLSLSDLRTESDHVRSTIAAYLNDLIGIGVDGFRVDAAKHVNPNDMAAVKARLTNPSVYFAQEVFPGSTNPNLQPAAFLGNGGVLEFNYAYALRNAFNGSIAGLQTLGSGSGFDPGAKATVFVENHDTERDGSTLNYRAGATDTLANVFMLAWNYGTPNVMSSFDFSGNDQSPPADANGYVTQVGCGAGWECQHRTRAIRNMVGFHNVTRADATVGNWWSDGSNAVAFSRGPAGAATGWIAVNNGTGVLPGRTFATGLPAGTYCDIIHGDYTNGTCGGPTVVVGAAGSATASVAAKDAVALDVNARVTGGATPTAPASPSPTATAGQVAEVFTVSGAPAGSPIYLVGSVQALGAWNTASALPLTQNGATWTRTVTLPANTYLEYKYIAKDPAGNVTWEQDPNHTATTAASGTATLTDTWHGANPTVSVTFAATVTTWFGQNVYVVGSIPALGSWNPAAAVPLSPASYPLWTGTVAVPPNTRFEYKFIKKDPDGTVEWENGANRVYTTGASGAVTLSGTWR